LLSMNSLDPRPSYGYKFHEIQLMLYISVQPRAGKASISPSPS
jgi:hypothetical protein